MRLLCATLILLAHDVQSHPVAATLGEAHWRPAQGTLEVAIRVPTHDLVDALARRGVDLFGPGGEAGAQRYVSETIEVHTPSGRQAIRWVGLEDDPTESWIYFEVPLASLAGTTLSHRLFFEQAPTQVNTLNLHDGPRAWTLVFSTQHPTHPVLPPGDPPATLP